MALSGTKLSSILISSSKSVSQINEIKIQEQSSSSKSILIGPLVNLMFGYAKIPARTSYEGGMTTNEIQDLYILDILLNHVARGQKKEAKEIIIKYPKLMTKKGIIIDFSEREIEGTPFQVAMSADDDEMCKMMIDSFDNKEELLKQYKHQLTNHQNKCYDFAPLIKVIASSQNNNECKNALDDFRQYFSQKGLITEGKLFNIQNLINAYKLYPLNYNSFGGYKSRKNILFCCQIIGYLQRLLPACYAQAYCEGYFPDRYFSQPLKRSLKLTGERQDIYFYPLNLNSKNGLGYDYAVFSSQAGSYRTQTITESQRVADYFESLCNEKLSKFKNLLAKLEGQKPTTCLMC